MTAARILPLAALLLVSTLAGADEDTEPLVEASRLPLHAQDLRDQGVSGEDVRLILDTAKGQGMSPAEASQSVEATSEAVKGGQSVDNLGSFVKQKLEEGLRGRDLAAAIHAEKGKGGPPDHAGGPPDHAGGPPEDAGSKSKAGENGASGEKSKGKAGGKSGNSKAGGKAGKGGN